MRIVISLLLALSVGAASAPAQLPGLLQTRPAVETTAKAEPSTQAPTTIDPIEIPLRAARAKVRLGEIDAELRPRGPVLEAQQAAAWVIDTLRVLTARQGAVPAQQLTRRAISSLAAEWNRWDVKVRDWAQLIRRAVVELDSLRFELDRDEELWQRTIARARVESAPQVIDEAVSVERQLRDQRDAVKARQQELLAAEVTLSRATQSIDAGMAAVRTAYANMRQQLFRIESPSLWSVIAAGGWPGLLDTIGKHWQSGAGAAVRFVKVNRGRVLFHIALTLALLVAVLRLQSHTPRVDAPRGASPDPATRAETGDHRWVLLHPRSSTLLMAALLTVLLYPAAPMIVYDIALLLSATAVWRLLPSLVPPGMVQLARWSFGLMAIDRLAIILLYSTPWHRLAVLGVAIAGLVLGVRARRRLRSLDYDSRRLPRIRWAQRFVTLAVLLVAISIPSNLLGNVTLALVSSAVVALTCLAILALVCTTVVNGLIAMAVEALTDDLKILERKGPQILQSSSRLVRGIAFASWTAAALAALLLWEPFKALVSQVLAFGVSVGTTDITIATVLLFFGTIWVGALLGRWLALVLEYDVLDRLDLPHGMPVTIASIVQYALTAIAFFLALAATGINVGQLTIIGGALSVGVGFGLQTIVNNFISGLILAFERPVSIGDTIQLDDMEGVVIKIGIRASVIRVGTGADLIVPNGRLLDRDLINWTRSGRNRRMELSLRVQTGIDPRAVVDLLPGIAAKRPDVSRVPAPTCLFLGFGDGSTDFLLRYWTDATDYRAVASELSLEVEEALRSAGFSSPNPQHDLHVRSVSADVLAALSSHGDQSPPAGDIERAIASP